MRLTGALAALILVSSCGCTLSKEPPLRSESQEECRQGPVNQTFRGELQGLVFQNVFLEELDGDEDVSRAAVSRQIHGKWWAAAVTEPLRPNASLLAFSESAGLLLGISAAAAHDELFRQFAGGETLLPGSRAYAMAYGGHQFGYWAGQLGDGRAINLGEIVGSDGGRWEAQLKGAGRTPFSRKGDGRAVLRSSVREFLASEFLGALGLPTSRALSIVYSLDHGVVRDQFYDGNMKHEPAAIVMRLAPSWVRFGTFELFNSRKDVAGLRKLADWTIRHHYPEFSARAGEEQQRPNYLAFLHEVARRTGKLFAGWQALGFVHGVLNTDNLSVLGIAIDFGPYAFLDRFDPEFVPNTSDDEARYSYKAQPAIGAWNVMKLFEALKPLLQDHSPPARLRALGVEVEATYWEAFHPHRRRCFLERLGLGPAPVRAAEPEGIGRRRRDVDGKEGEKLLGKMLGWMERYRADMTLSLSTAAEFAAHLPSSSTSLGEWAAKVASEAGAQGVGASEAMEEILKEVAAFRHEFAPEEERCFASGPPIYLPRNYLMHQAIDAAARGDASATQDLLATLSRPAEQVRDAERHARLRAAPPEEALVRGIAQLSCSS